MKTLYVLYDPRCGLCTEVKEWLAKEPAFVNLQLLASDSDEARLQEVPSSVCPIN
jgi:predicted DCC family thiol-disulfide oxidoreductase YuxK